MRSGPGLSSAKKQHIPSIERLGEWSQKVSALKRLRTHAGVRKRANFALLTNWAEVPESAQRRRGIEAQKPPLRPSHEISDDKP